MLVVGLGQMGKSHCLAYHGNPEFEIVGLCSRSIMDQTDLPAEFFGYQRYSDFDQALRECRPDGVCICTWPDTHYIYAKKALMAGAHVFLEKPIAETVAQAEEVVKLAKEAGLKLVVGYILRHHPSWIQFVELARTLGKPLVMRMNLNQQSSGNSWRIHKKLMESVSPIVDCGVHYLDIMCQMSGAGPVRVHAVGVRLSEEIADDMYNYGHLHVVFDDGSVGWYEAGWGPMVSETSFFIKDVFGPRGSVSITGSVGSESDNVDSHTVVNRLHRHFAETDESGEFIRKDIIINSEDEPDHLQLCAREQAYFLTSIRENLDLSNHWRDGINSLRVVLAADESIRQGRVVDLT